jgi:hypothetical protein
MKKWLAGMLVVVALVFVMIPALAIAAEDEPLAPKLTASMMQTYWEKYWTDGPVVSFNDAAEDTGHYVWAPFDYVNSLFGTFQYRNSQSYVGTTRYNQRNNPYNSAYPYNEAIFS